VFDITGFAQTLPQRSLDRGSLARRLEAENPTIGIVGCRTRSERCPLKGDRDCGSA
jgi:hypothetical protein